MKKILFIDDRVTYGGKATHITHVANELHKRGYEVHIATPNKALFQNKVENGIYVKEYAFNNEKVKKEFVYNLNKEGYDVVNAHVFATFVILLLNLPHRNFRLIITDHVGVYNAQEYECFKEYFEETKKADAVVTVSLAGRRIFYKAGHRDNKLHTIYNGVPYQKENDYEKTNKVIYSGRIEKNKGVFFLIEAMKEIHEKHPQVILDIFGDGNGKAELEKLIHDYGMGKYCFIKGFDNNMCEQYKNYDVLIMPSESESCSYSILEAMMGKCNVLASDVDGNRELIQNEITGLLFEYGNVDSLIFQLDSLLKNKEWAEILRSNAFYAVNKYYTVKNEVDELEKLF